jgi:hypothetical protein
MILDDFGRFWMILEDFGWFWMMSMLSIILDDVDDFG